MSAALTKPHLHISIPVSGPCDQVHSEVQICSFFIGRIFWKRNKLGWLWKLKCFSARVQIPLKHVRGIEWLICIKKKKGSRMERWKEVRKGENEGSVSELMRPKSLESHVTTHKDEGTQSLKFSTVLSDPNRHIFVPSLFLSSFLLTIYVTVAVLLLLQLLHEQWQQ